MTRVRWAGSTALVMLLTACSPAAEGGAERSPPPPPMQSEIPTRAAPTPEPPTASPPATETTTTTSSPTSIPAEAIHVFPIRPPDAASYASGGHGYPATDIFAAEGTAFVAVTSGVIQGISRVDTWDPAVDDGATKAGLFVSLVGDDGVRYYGSHLSEIVEGIEAGVRVEAGDLLGYVGTSGNARGTPPHLHFGISRPTALEDWEIRRGEIDPVPFLDAWRIGDTTATPEL